MRIWQAASPSCDVPVSSLPQEQIDLVNAVSQKNPNTVIVLNTGTPIVLKEIIDNPNVKAVLNMWHTGQEGGTAIARQLLGQANPSGHSPMTWPLNNHDTIEGYDQPRGLYDGDKPGKHPERLNGGPDGSANWTQGIYSGYRYYDQMQIPVQFPFGYGLSYTSFAFSNLKTTPNADGSMGVEFDVKNTGTVDGTEVAQVYVGPGPEVKGVQQAVRALRGFERVELKAGETRHVTIKLEPRSFQYWGEPVQKWVTNAGERTIFVGDADALDHLRL
jgi:beta-glucosidase